MTLNHSFFKILTAAFIFVAMCSLLKFGFKTPNLALVFLLVFSGVMLLIKTVIFSYLNPYDLIYQNRKTILGVMSGAAIGVLLFGMEAIESNDFVLGELGKFMLIGVIIGFVFNEKPFWVKKRRRKFLAERDILNEKAYFSSNKGGNGLLSLTASNVKFGYINQDENLFSIPLKELEVEIDHSKFLHIPKGIVLKTDNQLYTVNVSFPFYWQKKINAQKVKFA